MVLASSNDLMRRQLLDAWVSAVDANRQRRVAERHAAEKLRLRLRASELGRNAALRQAALDLRNTWEEWLAAVAATRQRRTQDSLRRKEEGQRRVGAFAFTVLPRAFLAWKEVSKIILSE